MKSFYLFLILCFESHVNCDTNSGQEVEDMCSEMTEEWVITTAFRWNQKLYFFMRKGDQKMKYRLIDFKWDGNHFTYKRIENITNGQGWHDIDNRLIFIQHTKNGYRLVAMERVLKREENNKIVLKGNVINLKKGGVDANKASKVSFSFNNPGDDGPPLIGSSDNNLTEEILSILPFPPSKELDRRLFIYYKVKSYEGLRLNCEEERTGEECYQIKRIVFEGINTTNGENFAFIWINQSSPKYVDQKSHIIDSTTSLSDYQNNGNRYHFDLIEFFGSQFKIFRVFITKEKIIENLKLIKYEHFDWIFNCSSLPTRQPDLRSIEPPKETKYTDGFNLASNTTKLLFSEETDTVITTQSSKVTEISIYETMRQTVASIDAAMEETSDNGISSSKPCSSAAESEGRSLIVIIFIVLVIVIAVVVIVWIIFFFKIRGLSTPVSAAESSVSSKTPPAINSTNGVPSQGETNPMPFSTRSVRSFL